MTKKNEKKLQKTETELQKPEQSQSGMIQNALIEMVRRNDVDPDKLEKFINLQIKMEDRQAKQAFFKAMANFQGECPIVKKTKHVKFNSKSGNTVDYKFSPLDEIADVIKPILKKHGLSYTFNIKNEMEKEACIITTISHMDGHEKVFDYPFHAIHDDNRMNMSQRRKSAVTYAKRAAIENALGIVTAEEDDDARRAIDKVVTEEQIKTIKDLMGKTDTTEKALFNYLKIDNLTELSEYEAKRAINTLKQKRVVNVQNTKL